MNQVVIAGRITADPEERGNGNGPATFSLATDDRKKVGDEWVSDPSFIDVTCWEHKFGPKNCKAQALALSKGSYVLVVGRLKQERWEKDGKKGSRLGIIAESVSSPAAEVSNAVSGSRPSEDKQDEWGF